VASISAADNEIGQMIADAIDKVGKDGVITVEESQSFGMDMDLVEGMRFDRGLTSRRTFATDVERQEAVLENAYVLLVASKISSVRDVLPVLEKVMQSGPSTNSSSPKTSTVRRWRRWSSTRSVARLSPSR